MTNVHIYRPSKTAMQSGRAKARTWVLEYDPSAPKVIDPLMGWVGSSNTQTQVRLRFSSREAAIAYAERNGLTYECHEPLGRRVRPKSYADNFAFDRRV
ncbi:MAG: ETC complex I subunit [Rhodospirillales bacterium]|nr:ETC complex I subunit [Rhodospirillales bacterium]